MKGYPYPTKRVYGNGFVVGVTHADCWLKIFSLSISEQIAIQTTGGTI